MSQAPSKHKKLPKGKLRIIKVFGESKDRTTILTQDTNSGRIMIIKTLNTKAEQNPVDFLNKLFSNLRYPTIIQPYNDTSIDIIEDTKVRISFPYYMNGSLYDIIKEVYSGKIVPNWDDTTKTIIMYGIALGLNYLHSKNMVHMFLNPSCILMTAELHPKLSNFWYKQFIDFSAYITEGSETSNYVAPELKNNIENPSPAVDIFAFARVIISMVAGITTFPKIEALKFIPQSLSPKLARMLCSCVDIDPEQRPTIKEIISGILDGTYIFANCDLEKFQAYREKVQQDSMLQPSDVTPSPLNEIFDEKSIAEIYRQETENGNQRSNLLYGIIKREGKGCTINKRAAIRSFKRAAEAGIPEAQFNYGLMAGIKPKNAQARAESLQFIKAAADGGNSAAQLRYALLVSQGQGVTPDFGIIDHYMRLAIEQENEEACYTYAEMLAKGINVPQDQNKALLFYQIAADLGNVDAQIQYAKILRSQQDAFQPKVVAQIARYLRGAIYRNNTEAYLMMADLIERRVITPVSPEESARIFKVASDNGSVEAQKVYAELICNGTVPNDNPAELAQYLKIAADNDNMEGIMRYADALLNGIGVPKNVVLGAQYLKRAADKGNVKACFMYGTLCRSERNNLSANQAIIYFKKAADKGDVEAQYMYAELLLHDYTKKDLQKAIEYFEKAANAGHVKAMYNLGVLFVDGNGNGKGDVLRGEKLIKEAAILGDPQAQIRYAETIRNSQPEKALEYFKKAADKGMVIAMSYLADMYSSGEIKQDEEKASEYFEMAAKLDDEDSCYEIALRYKNGIGVPQDEKKAAQYMKQAADNHHKQAMIEYAKMLQEGIGVPANKQKADHYLSCAEEDSEEESFDDDESIFPQIGIDFFSQIMNPRGQVHGFPARNTARVHNFSSDEEYYREQPIDEEDELIVD